ncbi:hypothetical protein HWV62_32280 [Athelia sp. TMB]|nr:hypothetical protein HWV62_32280 [Athelia sp. TMB]
MKAHKFVAQIQELVNYVVRNQPDEDRAAFIKPFQEALKTGEGKESLENDPDRRRKIFTMVSSQVKGLGEGSEKEIEGFFNLLYSHLFALYSPDSPEIKERLTALLQIISSSPSQQSATRYRILSNLFNATPRKSALRLPVYNALLQVATANDQLDLLGLSLEDVEKWLGEWAVTPEEKSAFLKSIVDAYDKSDQPITAYQYKLSYVRSLDATSEAGKKAAVDAIATALRLPTIFDFDPLLKLDAVVASKDSELFSLLQIFLNEGLAEFNAWEGSHPGVLEQHQLEKTQLERKIRLLTLASLGFHHIGQDLPYATIASALQIDESDVEKWAIDVIRVGLLSGKLSQNTQTLHVIRSAARTFEHDQWQALEKRLVAWKAGLAAVLEVVTTARGTSTGSAKQEAAAAA